MISVVVPIYNAEKFLCRCVDSILTQTYTNFELLLINDGSTDNCGSICDGYIIIDNRVRVFHKENGGALSARNLGLEKAKGEWITFVDSDDTLRENALELLYKISTSSVDAIIANTNQVDLISGEEWLRLLLDSKIRCELWGGLYKKNLLLYEKIEIPSSIVIGEDFLTNLQYALKCKKIRLIADNIYNYTQGESTSLVNSYKLTLTHEKELLQCMNVILSGRETEFAYEIFRKRYLILERLVLIGQRPYREEWVKALMLDKKKYIKTLGIKELILLSVPCAIFCRFVLNLGIWLKKYFVVSNCKPI